ncbi:MAG: UbiA family prenyltransferase [Rhodospirillales bacterium]
MRDVLAVDLDGTLLRSDMLLESGWSAIGSSASAPFRAVRASMEGKASLKRYLAEVAKIDVTSLPYDPDVIAYITKWRKEGGKTALVTATDQRLAQAIADHLGLFDEVHGSDGTHNLKGEKKAEFLSERFGRGQFSYMGDAAADLAVWHRSKRAITVNAPSRLRKATEQAAPEVEHLTTRRASIAPILQALRCHQWLKNTLVFLPMLAAHQLDSVTLIWSLLAFLSFCCIASSGYIVNDLLDLAADRAHPRKRNRPFAAGQIPIGQGTWMAAGALFLGIATAWVAGPASLLVMCSYFVLTILYSLLLKRQMVLDVFMLAGLYTTRIIAGGVATAIVLSPWLLAFSMFFFLSLAAVKRQAELVDNAAQGKLRATGRGYHVDDLAVVVMIAVSAGFVAMLVLALYINSPSVVALYAQPKALWGVCAVLLYWITRTVMVAHRGEMHDDPLVYATKDRVSQVCLVIIIALILLGALL